jgi:glycosyltransferase involved in cell wall biosynthesis
MKGLNIKLKIIGEGPSKEDLKRRAFGVGNINIEFLGYKAGEELKDEIKKAMFVILPSEWYENNPRTIIEGFALGKPAIGARIGGIPELVKDDETGLTFEPWNADDLKRVISQLQENPSEVSRMGKNARNMVDEELNPAVHYEKLMDIYKQVLG